MAYAEGPSATEREYRLKSAFLFNFLKFIQWPEESDLAPIYICFVGSYDLERLTRNFTKDKRIKGQNLLVRQVSYKELDSCRVIYSDDKEIRPIIVSKRQILTISSSEEVGGIIQFYVSRDKLRFAIDIKALRNSKLKASSELLKLARIIGDEANVYD